MKKEPKNLLTKQPSLADSSELPHDRDRIYQQLFHLPREEVIIEEYRCFQKGRLGVHEHGTHQLSISYFWFSFLFFFLFFLFKATDSPQLNRNFVCVSTLRLLLCKSVWTTNKGCDSVGFDFYSGDRSQTPIEDSLSEEEIESLRFGRCQCTKNTARPPP